MGILAGAVCSCGRGREVNEHAPPGGAPDAECLAFLEANGIAAKKLGEVRGVRTPVRVTGAVAGLALVPRGGREAVMDCGLARGLFDKRDFTYLPNVDEFRCPAGQRAVHRFTTDEKGLTFHKNWSCACPRCPLKAQCATGEYRRIARWEHEHILDAMQRR